MGCAFASGEVCEEQSFASSMSDMEIFQQLLRRKFDFRLKADRNGLAASRCRLKSPRSYSLNSRTVKIWLEVFDDLHVSHSPVRCDNERDHYPSLFIGPSGRRGQRGRKRTRRCHITSDAVNSKIRTWPLLLLIGRALRNGQCNSCHTHCNDS